MTRIEVKIKGTKPLLMNAPNAIGNSDNKKKIKYIPEVEAEAVTYRNGEGVLCIPALAILSMMRKSAVNFKAPGRGKKTLKEFVYSGLRIEGDDLIPLDQQEYVIDSRIVVRNRARVMAWKPRFNEWSLTFVIEIVDDATWDGSMIRTVLEDGGKYSGLLDFRPLYGTFEIVSMIDLDTGKPVE